MWKLSLILYACVSLVYAGEATFKCMNESWGFNLKLDASCELGIPLSGKY